jgi:hypothetical protein
VALLTAAEYPSVRAAIDLSLDSESLPDATIALPIYLDAADLAIKARDPLWATRTGDALTLLTNACVYLTAALIAPAMARLLGETYADGYRYQLAAVDWDARAAALRGRAEDSLNALLTPEDGDSDRPTFFAVASGRRGRW